MHQKEPWLRAASKNLFMFGSVGIFHKKKDKYDLTEISCILISTDKELFLK